MRFFALAGLMVWAAAGSAQADVVVSFVESAPRDRFVMENKGKCALPDDAILTIDVSGASGGLYFDTTASGAGVEVFQPLKVESGDVSQESVVNDGDTLMRLHLGGFKAGGKASVTIDVDDRGGDRGPTQVGKGEMDGAVVMLSDPEATAIMNAGAVATLKVGC